jgi:transposase
MSRLTTSRLHPTACSLVAWPARSPSRSTHSARALYEGMRPGGVLMSDGYEPYAAIAGQHRLVHLGCWAHRRRYFHEALQALPKDRRGPEQLPARFIELIGQPYKVELRGARVEACGCFLGIRCAGS